MMCVCVYCVMRAPKVNIQLDTYIRTTASTTKSKDEYIKCNDFVEGGGWC